MVDSSDRRNFEVVFFVKYVNYVPFPSSDEVTNYFSKYGTVHHVKMYPDKKYVFVYMTSLSTTVPYKRTRTTISQIIKDIVPENKFYINVARSNRRRTDNRNDINIRNPHEGIPNVRSNLSGGSTRQYRKLNNNDSMKVLSNNEGDNYES